MERNFIVKDSKDDEIQERTKEIMGRKSSFCKAAWAESRSCCFCCRECVCLGKRQERSDCEIEKKMKNRKGREKKTTSQHQIEEELVSDERRRSHRKSRGTC